VEAHASSLLLLIPLFPLIGAFLNGMFGVRIQKTLGKQAVHTIAIAMPAISCVLSWIVFFQLRGLPEESRALAQVGWDWMHIGFVDARFAFWADPLTSMMLLIITTVGTLIHLYSVGYMAEETAYWRFFCYLNLFVTMMLVLVLGDNFLVMFIGWEGVGLASYLLIGFWYKDLGNAASGMKAFVVNRFGDACFVVGMFILFWGLQGTWEPKSKSAVQSTFTHGQSASLGGKTTKQEEDAIGARPATVGANAEGKFELEKPASTLTFNTLRTILDDPARREAFVGKTGWFGLPLVFWVCILFFLGATAQVRADPVLRLAAGRDGRPDAGVRADPRGDDGDRRRLHDRAAQLPLRAVTGRVHVRRVHRRERPRCSPRRWACSSTTSRRCSPTRRCRSSASCSSASAWARTGPASSTC
jgi:NADH-quinone oxidoreductase subunit L